MKTNRRNFLMSAALVGSSSALVQGRSDQGARPLYKNYSTLDRVLQQPVLKRELFRSPVMIESVELLRDRDNFLCRVRSREGAGGLSIGHPFIARLSYPVFVNRLVPFFLGKDARDLDQLIYRISETSVKSQGVPFCVQLAMLEFAILDMLGNIVDKPVGLLIGEMLNPEVSIYLGHHYSNLRKLEPEKSLVLMKRDVLETRAKAIKLRAGLGDNMASDKDNAPGRTEKLIRMARKIFGDDMVLMIDGNGSYSVKEAIRIGKILEEYN